MQTAVLYDPRYLDHDTGAGHPERPARLSHAISVLEQKPWFGRLERVDPSQCDQHWIETIHSADYVERARRACHGGQHYIDTPDVAISSSSFETALLASGGALAIADSVMHGGANNGFAMIRPPGHHANADSSNGFCFFNNAAIAAQYLRQKYDRVAIIDIDTHAGIF